MLEDWDDLGWYLFFTKKKKKIGMAEQRGQIHILYIIKLIAPET